VVSKKSGLTRRELVDYFRDLAPVLVPVLQRRKVPGVDDQEGLLELASRSVVELQISPGRVPHPSEPDWAVLELRCKKDKGRMEDLVTVARALRGLLERLSLESVPVSTGPGGMCVFVPVSRGHTFEETCEFMRTIADALGRALPKESRRVELDASQNSEGGKVLAPWSPRDLKGAPVCTPLRWNEIENGLDLAKFDLQSMRQRLEEAGDLFAPALKGRQRLPRFKARE
jgi:bifunctional non-homologous end joining protein LigD